MTETEDSIHRGEADDEPIVTEGVVNNVVSAAVDGERYIGILGELSTTRPLLTIVRGHTDHLGSGSGDGQDEYLPYTVVPEYPS